MQVSLSSSYRTASLALTAAAASLASSAALGGLTASNYFANAALSIDGLGVLGAGSGQLQANVPVGSQVLGAYLYTASVWDRFPNAPVTFNGTQFNPSGGTLLGPNTNRATTIRYDVTSIVRSVVEGGSGGLYNFNLQELGDNDGSVLVVAYGNASTQGRSALIYDGELATTGDVTRFNFANPYSGGNMLMSLASSFSNQPGLGGGGPQYSLIDVRTSSNPNARRLTSSAGGADDRISGQSSQNGALITVGGIGDDPANVDPFAVPGLFQPNPNPDDELYNLALGNVVDANPFVSLGDTWLELNTLNPSNDDNVFGMFVSADFMIDNPIPAPPTLALLAAVGLAGRRRRR
jgi:hypothetical protein